MIKVLHILSDTNIGGAGRSVLNYLTYMDRRGFEAAAVVPAGSELTERIRALDVPVTQVDCMRDKSLDLGALRPLMDVIRREAPDIVHTHGSLSGRVAGTRCKKTVVFTRHSAFPFPDKVTKTPLKLGYRYLYTHFADRIVAISPAGAEQLKSIGVPEDRIEVMMNGVAPVPRRDINECAAYRRSLGIGPGDFVAVMVARIEEYKGHLDALEAVRKTLDRGAAIKLVIAGSGSFEERVRERARELGLQDAVCFTGFLSDVSPVLSIADVQINASYLSETSSLSIIEGMSMGVPAVASNCCGNPWLVDDGISGLLFKPRDSGELSEKLRALMENPAERQKLSMGAERKYRERFTGEIFAKRLEDIYTRTLEAKNGKRK